MMQDAQKKVKKLRKSRLWPSIVFFAISLVVACILLVLVLGIFVSHVIETKYATSLAHVQEIASGVDGRLQAGEDPQVALDQTAQYMGNDPQVFIMSDSGDLLASVGSVTLDAARGAMMKTDDGEEVYWDGRMETNIPMLNEAIQRPGAKQGINTFDLFNELRDSHGPIYKDPSMLFGNGDHAKDGIFEYAYWQSVPLPGTGSRLFVKSYLTLQKDDLSFGFAFVLVSGLMFLIIITVQFANVIRQVRLRRRIERLLRTDIITGGNNWYGFEENAWKVLEKKESAGRTYAVVNLSVAKYQSYCSLHGAKAGEQLLVLIDRLLSSAIGKDEICAHVNGAEFALFLLVGDGDQGRRAAIQRVEQLLATIAARCLVDGSQQAGVALSKLDFRAGICFIEPSATAGKSKAERRQIDFDDYFANAGIAKDSLPEDEAGVACFSRKMWDDQLWQHKVENSMQTALENQEFEVYVQPKYNPNTEKLEGAEALVRWISPAEGMIPPGRFIPIFEKTGFVTKLDDYMISHVAALQSAWLEQGKQIVPVSVNVSRAHFAQPDLAEHICSLVDMYQLPHEYLEIELTESAFFDDKQALLKTVHKLQEYGFYVSMDDFGSGYSSLNSLKDLPLDVLKLDAGFFRGDDFDTRGEIVVAEAIALAKRLDMRIVAEGIEKEDQVEFLAKQDCDMIQGYYYAKPMPADEYAAKLD